MPDEQPDVKPEEPVEQQQEVAEQPQEDQQEASVEEKPQPKKKDAEYNFAELRRQREEDKRRADEAERRSNELLEILKQSKTAQTKEERDVVEEELSRLSKDDLATIDNVDKKLSRASKSSKKEVDEVKKELAELKAHIEEQKFRSKYPDLDDILSPENIELLKKEEPEIAETLGKMVPGSKEQVVMAYKYIKRMMPPKQQEQMEKKRAIDNSKKPMSVQAISKQSAIGNAHAFENGLSKELKDQLWKEMQDAMKKG